jgi:DNA-binding response OmpR family regulator
MTLEAPRVLIVDDEHDFASLVERWLTPRYRAVSLTNGRDCLAALEDGGASLLVLDVRLQGEDGFELCRRVRADPRFASTPVLFLTGSREEDLYLRNLNAGGTGYLAKPVGRAQLLDAVEALVSGVRDERETGTGD